MRWFSGSTTAVKVGDAVVAGRRGEVAEQRRREAAALVGVGDRERDLGARVLAADVAGVADDLAGGAAERDEPVRADAVDVDVAPRLAGEVGRRRRRSAARASAPEARAGSASIAASSSRRTEPHVHRRAVAQDDVGAVAVADRVGPALAEGRRGPGRVAPVTPPMIVAGRDAGRHRRRAAKSIRGNY